MVFSACAEALYPRQPVTASWLLSQGAVMCTEKKALAYRLRVNSRLELEWVECNNTLFLLPANSDPVLLNVDARECHVEALLIAYRDEVDPYVG